MKIIREYYDYYDSCMGYGIDLTAVYDRKMSEIEDDKNPLLIKSRKMLFSFNHSYSRGPFIQEVFYSKKKDYYLESGCIGFCGIIYPFIQVVVEAHPGTYKKYKKIIFYNGDDFIRYLDKINYKSSNSWDGSVFKKDLVSKIFEPIENIEFFFDLQQPCWANVPINNINTRYNKNRKFVINPKLEDFYFFKKFDAFSAFQQINMFLSGVLGAVHPPTIEISDEVKKFKHGFDDWSFKNKVHNRKYNK